MSASLSYKSGAESWLGALTDIVFGNIPEYAHLNLEEEGVLRQPFSRQYLTTNLVAFIHGTQDATHMNAYRATGSFRAGKNDQPFCVDLVAGDEADAEERLYSNIGSRHGAKRRFVKIEKIEKIDPSDSTSPVVVAHFAQD